MIMSYVLSPYNPKYYCNDGNNKENVNDAACTVSKEADGPSDDEDYCYKIK